jgi:hypothetical protein
MLIAVKGTLMAMDTCGPKATKLVSPSAHELSRRYETSSDSTDSKVNASDVGVLLARIGGGSPGVSSSPSDSTSSNASVSSETQEVPFSVIHTE